MVGATILRDYREIQVRRESLDNPARVEVSGAAGAQDSVFERMCEERHLRLLALEWAALARFKDLFPEVLFCDPPQSVRACLRKISASYLSGKDETCLIWCRSAIEGALRNAISDETHARHGLAGDPSIPQRIRVAEKEGLLDAYAARAAGRVRLRANKLLHYEAADDVNALGSIQDTMMVVKQLCGKRQ